jgi:transposase
VQWYNLITMMELTLFSQLLMYLPRNIVESKTRKFSGNSPNGHFTTKAHLTVLLAAQIKGWDSLRAIESGFLANQSKLYHLGIRQLPKRSTISDANSKRNSKIFEEVFYDLLRVVNHKLHNSNKLLVQKQLNLFDSTIITLSLELFDWATFRRHGGFKIHTMFNVQSQSPVFARITHGNVNDIEGINFDLSEYSGSIVVFDRGYSSFDLFKKLVEENIIFVTRLKSKISYKAVGSKQINRGGVITDEIITFTGDKIKRKFKGTLRLVKYCDPASKKRFDFLTNNLVYSPRTIAYLYKKRWDIELFFKWIKQHLVIKKYFGYSENAVNIQVWTALISYLLIIYVKESIGFQGTMLEFTRLVRESLFKSVGLIDLKHIKNMSKDSLNELDPQQTHLFED